MTYPTNRSPGYEKTSNKKLGQFFIFLEGSTPRKRHTPRWRSAIPHHEKLSSKTRFFEYDCFFRKAQFPRLFPNVLCWLLISPVFVTGMLRLTVPTGFTVATAFDACEARGVVYHQSPDISQPKPTHLRYCYWGPYPKCISVLYSQGLWKIWSCMYVYVHLFYMYFLVKTFGYCN